MPSLLEDSLEFLSEQLQRSKNDMPDAVYNIGMRTLQFREYANPVTEELDFDSVTLNVDEARIPVNDQDYQDDKFAPLMTEGLPPVPNIPGIDTDVLRNLLMSWFYCGYYSGLAHSNNKKS